MKPIWSRGDLFLIRNLDQKFTPCQILGRETRTLFSAACAFYDERITDPSQVSTLQLRSESCFSTLLVTPDLLDDGSWPVVGTRTVPLHSGYYPHARIMRIRQVLRFFGLEQSVLTKNLGRATIHGSGVVKDFLDAFFGLRAWDDWYRADYLDGFLLTPAKKPKNLIYSRRDE